jgi:Ca2+-binding EF-hand superfamily protein
VRTRGRLGNSFNVIDISKDGTVSIKVMNIRNGEEETGWLFKLRKKENK